MTTVNSAIALLAFSIATACSPVGAQPTEFYISGIRVYNGMSITDLEASVKSGDTLAEIGSSYVIMRDDGTFEILGMVGSLDGFVTSISRPWASHLRGRVDGYDLARTIVDALTYMAKEGADKVVVETMNVAGPKFQSDSVRLRSGRWVLDISVTRGIEEAIQINETIYADTTYVPTTGWI